MNYHKKKDGTYASGLNNKSTNKLLGLSRASLNDLDREHRAAAFVAVASALAKLPTRTTKRVVAAVVESAYNWALVTQVTKENQKPLVALEVRGDVVRRKISKENASKVS